MQTVPPHCDCCTRSARFRFAGPRGTPAFRCWRHAVFYDPVFQRALKVAAVIGTLLFLINQLDVVLSGKITAVVVLKIILTFLVPFLVATYSALQINQLPKLPKAPSSPAQVPPATLGATT
jgi:hypothetical protein